MQYPVPQLTTPDYQLRYEVVLGRKILHMTVFRWSPRVARGFYRDFQAWFDTQGEPVFVAHYPQFGALQRKFIRRIGFIHLCPAVDFSGRECNLYTKVK